MRLTIFAKLLFSFLMIISLLAVVSFIAVTDNRRIVHSFTKGEQHYRFIVMAATEASSFSKRAEGHLFLYLLLHDKADKDKFIARCASLQEQLEILDKRVQDPTIRVGLERLRTEALTILPLGTLLIDAHDRELAKTGRFGTEKHAHLMKKLFAATSLVRGLSVELAKSEVALEANIKQSAIQEAEYLRVKLIWLGLSLSIVVVLLSYFFSRAISRPIIELKTMANEIGGRNFSVRTDITSKDEIGSLASSLNHMVDNLQKSEQQLRTQEQLLQASSQLIRESEEKLRSIFENVEDVYYETTVDGTIREVSPSIERLSKGNYRREDLIGKSMNDIYSDPGERRALVAVIQEQGSVTDYEIRLRNRDGSVVWCAISSRLRFDAQGRPETIVGSMRDITERKQAETQIRFQANLLANISDAVFATDRQFNILYWNTAAEQQYGWTSAEVLGCHFMKYIQPQYIGDSRKTVMQKIVQEGSWRGELLHNRRDGTLFPVHVTISEVRNAEGHIIGHIAINRDITERKWGEELLRASEGKYRDLIELARDAIFVVGRNGSILLANQKACELMGCEREEALKMNIADTYLVEERNVASERIALAAKGEHWRYERAFVRKDGAVFAVEAAIGSLPDGTIQGVIRDITERKRLEKVQKESEERLSDIISSMADWVWEVDKNGVYTYSSQKGFDLFGSTREDVIGKTPFDFMPPDEAKRVGSIFSEIVAKKARIRDLENWNIGKGGERICLLTNGVPILDAAGNLTGYRGVDKDITDRKRAEEEHEEERTLLSTLIDAIPDEIAVKDLERRFVLVNPACLRALGKESARDVLGKKDEDLIPEEFANEARLQEEQLIATGKPFLNVDGKTRLDPITREVSRSILITKTPLLDHDGTATGFVVVNRDITRHKRAEDRLRATQEELHRLAGHLENVREEERKHLSQEFHDQLGQTLTAVKMDLSMLQRIVSDTNKELSRPVISLGIESMHGMIDKAIGTIREIVSELRPEMLDQLGIVPTLEWEVERFQLHSGISCTFNSEFEDIMLGPKESIAVYRIFQEAVTNVARHAKATLVVAELRKEGEDLVLEIKDNGVGIAADAGQDIRSFGLIGMRERAILLGGTLEIRGAEGKGTAIRLRIPFKRTLVDGGAAL